MTPIRLIVVMLVMATAAAIFFWSDALAPKATVTEASLVPMGAGHALLVQIDNPGPPDRLTGVAVDGAARVMFDAGADGLALPAGSTPSLAMDGVHGMVMGLETPEEGRLVPITLSFARAGQVSTRARIGADSGMDHSVSYDVPEGEPAPSVSLAVTADEGGWRLTLETTNFTFSRDAVDGEHQSGVGHGHLYLNGLKLMRVYSTEIGIGALPPGTHRFTVALNTNDHRVYAVAGVPVAAEVTVSVD